jgi:hypothetical protein
MCSNVDPSLSALDLLSLCNQLHIIIGSSPKNVVTFLWESQPSTTNDTWLRCNFGHSESQRTACSRCRSKG